MLIDIFNRKTTIIDKSQSEEQTFVAYERLFFKHFKKKQQNCNADFWLFKRSKFWKCKR